MSILAEEGSDVCGNGIQKMDNLLTAIILHYMIQVCLVIIHSQCAHAFPHAGTYKWFFAFAQIDTTFFIYQASEFVKCPGIQFLEINPQCWTLPPVRGQHPL